MGFKINDPTGIIHPTNGVEVLDGVQSLMSVIVYYGKNMGVNWIRRGESKSCKRILTHNINANDDVYFEDYALAA